MSNRAVATLGLLALIGLVFLVAVVVAEILTARMGETIPYEVVIVLGAKNNAAISDGAVWRLNTHMLLHGGTLHLLINAYALYYALYVLGSVLEKLYGARRFLLLFLFSGFAGAFASYALTEANSVGASGAIFGILGAAVVFGFKYRGILPSRIRHLLTAGLLPWVVINIFIGLAFERIDNAAHMGGMIGGALLAVVLGTDLSPRQPRTTALLQWAILVLLGVFMVYSLVAYIGYGSGCAESIDSLEACFEALTPS
jgi:rhomboid protease GluP